MLCGNLAERLWILSPRGYGLFLLLRPDVQHSVSCVNFPFAHVNLIIPISLLPHYHSHFVILVSPFFSDTPPATPAPALPTTMAPDLPLGWPFWVVLGVLPIVLLAGVALGVLCCRKQPPPTSPVGQANPVFTNSLGAISRSPLVTSTMPSVGTVGTLPPVPEV